MARTYTGVFALACSTGMALHAQVGHDPGASPFNDLRATKVISVGGGYLAGEAGKAGVGPTDGPLVGARFDWALTAPLEAIFTASVANLNRNLIDATTAPGDSIIGTAKQTLFIIDVGIALRLTGRKTWNRTAPYLGVALGLAFGSSVPEDSLSGFKFRTHFQVNPLLGIKVFASERWSLRAEGRVYFWRLTYPAVFFQSPENDPLAPPVLNPLTDNERDWTAHPTLVVSIGYTIGY